MRVVTFHSDSGNFIKAGHTEYFVLWSDQNPPQLVSNACPHRGGPLHLGTLDALGRRLVCPWHDMKTPVSRLTDSSMPLIRSGNRLVAVLDEAADTPIAVSQREIKANRAPCQLKSVADTGTPDTACPAVSIAERISRIAADPIAA